MDPSPSRRALLASAGVAAVGLAGCSQLRSDPVEGHELTVINGTDHPVTVFFAVADAEGRTLFARRPTIPVQRLVNEHAAQSPATLLVDVVDGPRREGPFAPDTDCSENRSTKAQVTVREDELLFDFSCETVDREDLVNSNETAGD